jgi:hypothetical protein
MRRSVTVVGMFGLLAASFAYAADPVESTFYASRRAAFTLQGVGARAVSLGEAFTAVADDATAGYWNPGGLAQLAGINAVAVYDIAGAGLGISNVSVSMPAGIGVVGAGVTILSFGDYVVRDATGVRLGTAGMTDVAGTISYALAHPAWVGLPGSTGLTLEMVRETVGGSVGAFTIGSLIPLNGGLTLGWAAQHIGPRVQAFSLPGVARIGGVYAFSESFRTAADTAYSLSSREVWLSVGAEASIQHTFTLRAGYKWRNGDQGWGGTSGFAAGAGLQVGRLGVDYAYQPFGDLATSHRIALVYGLPRAGKGDSRAERGLMLAKRAYQAGDYRGAARLADDILSVDSEEFRAWQLLGNCRYAQGDYRGAVEAYDKALALNPDNGQLKSWADKVRKKVKGAEPGKPASKADRLFAQAKKLYKDGQYREALAAAESAVKADARNASAWEVLGDCRNALRDTAGAIEAYRQALKLNPGNHQLKTWLKRIDAL